MGSLSEISLGSLRDYREFVAGRITEYRKRLHYAVLLELVTHSYLKPYYEALCSYIDGKFPLKSSRHIRNKIEMFMILMKVEDAAKISYNHRLAIEEYLTDIEFHDTLSALKAFDQLKLFSIEEENKRCPFRERKLAFTSGVLYLGYHPLDES